MPNSSLPLSSMQTQDPQDKTICCGEGEHCAECTFFQDLNKDRDFDRPRFSKNAMGRCDFYNGPSKCTVEISCRYP